MSILIKGMEMPKGCSDCPMLDWDLDYIKCKVTGRHFKVKEEPFAARRVDDCPLVPVPAHGRLIDVKSLENMHFTESMYDAESKLFVPFVEVASAIFDTPTIIPAEEGE